MAILYRKTNKIKKAKSPFIKSLNIYRELAKNNFQAYGIKLANSLVMGVDLLNQLFEIYMKQKRF